MSWNANIFLGLLLTSITGSFLVLFWYLVGRVIDRLGYSQLLYRMLQVLPLFFLIPILYLVIFWRMRADGSVEGLAGMVTEEMRQFLHMASLVWLVSMIVIGYYFVYSFFRFHHKIGEYMLADRNTLRMLEDCRERVGLTGQVAVYRSYRARVPMVYGLVQPRIILPVEAYPEEWLRMIFLHELTHLKHRDPLVKQLVIPILITQWFNPFAWWLSLMVTRWSEYACDETVCGILGGDYDYGNAVFQLALPKRFIQSQMFVGLFEDKHQVYRRIKRMRRRQKIKKRSARLAALLTGLMLLLSSVSVLAAGNLVVDLYEYVYMASREYRKEGDLIDYSVPEQTKLYLASECTEEVGIATYRQKADRYYYDWQVSGHVLMRTEYFSVPEGELSVALLTEFSSEGVLFGLMTPEGEQRYVDAVGAMAYKFECGEAERVCVFIENRTEATVDVGGYYHIHR